MAKGSKSEVTHKASEEELLAAKIIPIQEHVLNNFASWMQIPILLLIKFLIGVLLIIASGCVFLLFFTKQVIIVAFVFIVATVIGIGLALYSTARQINDYNKKQKQPLNVRAEQIVRAHDDYILLCQDFLIWQKSVELGECEPDPAYAAKRSAKISAARTQLIAASNTWLKYVALDKLESDYRQKNSASALELKLRLDQNLAALGLPLTDQESQTAQIRVRVEEAKLLAELASETADPEEVELAERIEALQKS